MSLWPYILTLASSVIASIVGSSYVQWRRERRQEQREVQGVQQLAEDMKEMRKSHIALYDTVVSLRGQIKYLEGRMNFKHWRREEN